MSSRYPGRRRATRQNSIDDSNSGSDKKKKQEEVPETLTSTKRNYGRKSKREDTDDNAKMEIDETDDGTSGAPGDDDDDNNTDGMTVEESDTDEEDDEEGNDENHLSYRWIDSGRTTRSGKKEHQLLEAIVKGETYIIRVGDSILLSNGDENNNEKEEKQKQKQKHQNNDNKKKNTGGNGSSSSSKDGESESSALFKDDQVDYYKDDADKNDVYRNDGEDDEENNNDGDEPIDAFVARVERMWEEPAPPTNGDDSDNSEEVEDINREFRMKIKSRWYFQKSDIKSIASSNLSGSMSRKQLLSVMTHRDLILSNQADDNDVLSLIGKCNVIRRRPESMNNMATNTLPPHTFVCRYGINFGTPGTAIITSYDGKNDVWPTTADGNDVATKDNVTTGTTTSDCDADNKNKDGKESFQKDISDDKSDTTSDVAKHQLSSSSVGDKSNNDDGDDDVMSDDMSSSSFGGAESGVDTSSVNKSYDEVLSPTRPPITEGSTTVGKIQIGPNHQAFVPPHDKEEQGRYKRANDKDSMLVWKADAVDEDVLQKYLSDASQILVKFLRDNDLLMDDPYMPLPGERGEALARDVALAYSSNISNRRTGKSTNGTDDGDKENNNSKDGDGENGRDSADNNADEDTAIINEAPPLTLSNISSASSLSVKRNNLTRECKVEEILCIFQKKNYDSNEALKCISESPQDYVTIWTKHDKDLFNIGFRRYNGSLRLTSRNMMSSSSSSNVHNHKDVVDFHYRFKIPDQFRRYQDKKREQAYRMMECIEKRKSFDSIVPNRKRAKIMGDKKISDWTKTAPSDLVHATEDRRVLAKELLLDVQKILGDEKLAGVADAIRSYQNKSIPEVREKLEAVLGDHPDLLERFVDFLPRKFRRVAL